TPENKLRAAVSSSGRSDDDPIARAEKALADLSNQFGSWMDAECDRLDKARRDLTINPDASSKDALFHAAHELKGQAATLRFPAVASAARSLCKLIEHAPDIARVPSTLIDQHVDAVRAIHREYARSDAKQLASTLTKRLREVTDEFLVHENRDRPEVLEQLKAPSIAPE